MNLHDRNLSAAVAAEAPATKAQSVEERDSHLITLPGGDWKLWRWVGLRGAGFPASQVRGLTAEACAQAADDFNRAEEEVSRKHEEALNCVRAKLDNLKNEGRWDDSTARAPLVNAMRTLSKGKKPVAIEDPDVAPLVAALTTAKIERDAAYATYLARFEEAETQVSESLREVAQSSRFQEAVVWQNRNAFHTAVLPFLRQTTGAAGTERKKHKELIASYAQRYCLKNDTIGFFGPVGWARFVDDGHALKAQPGANLVAARRVYFETWCMEALADKLSGNKAFRPWFTPVRLPYLHLNGTSLSLPRSRQLTLSRAHTMAIQLCDGVKTAKQIALILSRAFPNEVKDEQAGYDLLDQLRAKYLIEWKLDVPVGLYPERSLRAALLRVEDEALRCTALGALDELEKHRVAVAQASGDAERLDQAMAEMEAYFIQVSGQTPTRSAGQMYAARTLVYEDCRRDVEVEMGPEFLRHLGPPLSLLLDAARWYTFETANFYREAFARVYHELAKTQGSTEVDAASFWGEVQSLVLNGDQNAGRSLGPKFQKRWAKILALPEGQNRVHYTVEQLRPLVREHFDVPHAGWSMACYHSPDVMVAATDAEAIRRDEYQLVLGEFHLGSNTLGGALFVAQHPSPEELFHAITADLPEQGLRMCPPKRWPGLTSRTSAHLIPHNHACWVVTYEGVRPPEPRKTYEVGSLVIVEEAGELLVKSRDGSLRCDIIEAFADAFHLQMLNKFKMFEPRSHSPRITIDRLVVTRESWLYPPEEFSFAYVKDDASRFVAARRWAQEQGMPRYVFAKSPIETKPVYVDFASPIYTNILAKIVRRTAEFKLDHKSIAISEMLPAHDQLWLADAAGQRYTSEFRIVAMRH